MKNIKVGFIGQGWIGKNYALDFEERGFSVIRYGKEPEYIGNKNSIASCDIVFVAVPTPTTPDGFDYSIIEDVLSLVGKGKTVIIISNIFDVVKQADKVIVLNKGELVYQGKGDSIPKEVSLYKILLDSE